MGVRVCVRVRVRVHTLVHTLVGALVGAQSCAQKLKRGLGSRQSRWNPYVVMNGKSGRPDCGARRRRWEVLIHGAAVFKTPGDPKVTVASTCSPCWINVKLALRRGSKARTKPRPDTPPG